MKHLPEMIHQKFHIISIWIFQRKQKVRKTTKYTAYMKRLSIFAFHLIIDESKSNVETYDEESIDKLLADTEKLLQEIKSVETGKFEI